MSSEGARATWTDERLDDLSHRMDEGFSRVDAELRSVRAEIGVLRTDLIERIDHQGERIDALQRTLLQLGGGMIASILVGAAGIAATQL
jgi:hypothetical protein